MGTPASPRVSVRRWLTRTRHRGYLPCTSVRKGGTVCHLFTERRGVVENDGRDERKCRGVLHRAQHPVQNRGYRIGCVEQCCGKEMGPGSMVPRLWFVPRVMFVFELHRLPSTETARTIRTNEEDERAGGLLSHVECNHVCHDESHLLYTREQPDRGGHSCTGDASTVHGRCGVHQVCEACTD